MSSNQAKAEQLKMPFGTAANQLRKQVLFAVLQRHGENYCFRCQEPIESSADLTMDHKQPWLGISPDLFWDTDNIAFSHAKCNIKAGRRGKRVSVKIRAIHGSQQMYRRHKCRCEVCVKAQRKRWQLSELRRPPRDRKRFGRGMKVR